MLFFYHGYGSIHTGRKGSETEKGSNDSQKKLNEKHQKKTLAFVSAFALRVWALRYHK